MVGRPRRGTLRVGGTGRRSDVHRREASAYGAGRQRPRPALLTLGGGHLVAPARVHRVRDGLQPRLRGRVRRVRRWVEVGREVEIGAVDTATAYLTSDPKITGADEVLDVADDERSREVPCLGATLCEGDHVAGTDRRARDLDGRTDQRQHALSARLVRRELHRVRRGQDVRHAVVPLRADAAG